MNSARNRLESLNRSTSKPRLCTWSAARFPVSLLALGVALSACTHQAAVVVAPPTPAPTEVAPEQPKESAGPTEPPPVVILSDVGFATPESVYFDRKRDVYLVSNINGSPHEKDGNGFISKITPEGEVTLKFIDGNASKTPLDAPKGLTVSGDTLYVADIDKVRMFDALTGVSKGAIEIKKSTFVNDVATGKDGVIYVSDSGLNEAWESTGTEAIYVILKGKAKKLVDAKKAKKAKSSLVGPNGLLAGEGGVWVVSQDGLLFWVSDKGEIGATQKVSAGQNDGIVWIDDGRTLVASWADGAVFAGKPGGDFVKEVSGLEAPADIGYDCQRNRLLIPLFKSDTVVLHSLNEPPATAPSADAP